MKTLLKFSHTVSTPTSSSDEEYNPIISSNSVLKQNNSINFLERYLLIKNYLSEFTTEEEKRKARENLGVLSDIIVLEMIDNAISDLKGDVSVDYDTLLKLENAIKEQLSHINNKQDVLVSGINLKTINSESLLGSEDIKTVGKVDPNSDGTGEIFNNYSHNKATGNYSHAEGNSTKAEGENSHAEGYNTTASATASHAEGDISIASGLRSHAEGWDTRAEGVNSHAEGHGSKATNEDAHAEGSFTKSSGFGSHAEGKNTEANGNHSHAEGYSAQANGNYSHAEGWTTKAIGENSHAEGKNTVANAYQSHVEGYYTTASGISAHAEGEYTKANEGASHAEGYGTIASAFYSHAEGCRTLSLGEASHSEGWSDNKMNTPLTTKDDIYKDWYDKLRTNDRANMYSIAFGKASHVEGITNIALGDSAHVEGDYNVAYGESAHAEGYRTKAFGNCSHVEGGKVSGAPEPRAYEYGDHVEGASCTTIDGGYSHAEGLGILVSGTASHGEGTGLSYSTDLHDIISVDSSSKSFILNGDYISANLSTRIDGVIKGIIPNAIVIINDKKYTVSTVEDVSGNTKVTLKEDIDFTLEDITYFAIYNKGYCIGKGSHIEGGGNMLIGDYSHIEGISNSSEAGESLHIEGLSNISSSGRGSHIEGASNKSSGDLLHVEGYVNNVSGAKNHVEGQAHVVNGLVNHVEGNLHVVNSNVCHVEGQKNIVNNNMEHAQGNFNKSNTGDTKDKKTRHSIGIGTSEDNRKNALEVMENGDHYIVGIGGYDGTNPESSKTLLNVINSKLDLLSSGTNIKTINGQSILGSGNFSIDIVGKVDPNSDGTGLIFNNYTDNVASGSYATSIGYATESTNNGSFATGYANTYSYPNINKIIASGPGAIATGCATNGGGITVTSSGKGSVAMGCVNGGYNKMTSSGNGSVAMGFTSLGDMTSSGNGSVAMGYAFSGDMTSSGNGSVALNVNTFSTQYAQTAIGCGNIEETESNSFNINNKAFIIGNAVPPVHAGASFERSNAFYVNFNGETHADGAYSSSGADYAEMFEWKDANSTDEDRVGRFVTFDGDKIRLANANDTYILGIISGAPTIVGDDPIRWQGKYLNDEWGRPIYEDIEVTYKEFEKQEDGTEIEVEKTRIDHVRKLNPDYNPKEKYIPRSERPEWAFVGMMGKLLVKQDGTLVAGSFCKPSVDGVATKAESGYYVMKVINENQALVLFR